ncbi:MAG TPA: hypothetical protein VFE84_04990, partial [Patescibacteria group bacterium]|nr:hypothetical protein [Patescibacteria group bacterium]
MNETVFQYQTKAEPPRQPAVVAVTHPWMLLDPPVCRRRLTMTEGTSLSALVESVGRPLLPPPALPLLKRTPLRLEGFAPALIALPYDRPLMD